MQFFFLLLFNVFLGAVLYLVISLKLERSATEFRERRLRKEMDEIIKEFNVTAERNISILENKIRLLRQLLEKTGDIKSLDITHAEEAPADMRRDGGEVRREPEYSMRAADESRDERGLNDEKNNAGALIKKGLILFFDKIIHILRRRSVGEYHAPVHDTENPAGGHSAAVPAPRTAISDGPNALIEKDLGAAPPVIMAAPDRKKLMTEKDILEIVAMADDRYHLVALLSEKGCEIEDISRYSGMPAGEVRLVLNLNREASDSSY